MPDTKRRSASFDFFGFAALSIGIGALQLVLDRGQLRDWFNSTEICVEALLAALGLYLFVVHLLTARTHPFVSPALFRDRNFLTGNIFIFVVGVVLFATLALLPPLLQHLLEYPVILTGLITAPRGFGMLLAMFLVNRLAKLIDMRMIIALGFGLTAFSLWQMSSFSLQMDYWPVIWSGFTQGVGTGLVYVPLSTVTFATLAPHFRNEGTALFSLVRNVGSSIGISAVMALFTRNSQVLHAQIGEHVTPFGDRLPGLGADALSSTASLAGLNTRLNAQAEMIAYTNDFRLMMLLALFAIPLIALLRVRARSSSEKPEMVAME
jgi:DHA2 family multidrug resistance protein